MLITCLNYRIFKKRELYGKVVNYISVCNNIIQWKKGILDKFL